PVPPTPGLPFYFLPNQSLTSSLTSSLAELASTKSSPKAFLPLTVSFSTKRTLLTSTAAATTKRTLLNNTIDTRSAAAWSLFSRQIPTRAMKINLAATQQA
ncbi:hypothetical protein BX616_004530, partial [Lobosporangium transversale]